MMQSFNKPDIHRPSWRMLELVGPAGAGKTTLARALSKRCEKIVIGDEIGLRNIRNLPLFLCSLPPLLPLVWQQRRDTRSFTWDEIKSLAYLKGWHNRFNKQAAQQDAIVLLDHGPVFQLARLYAFGPESLRAEVAERWWTQMFHHWASHLDLIIWLDAPDPILEARINHRTQRHTVKGKDTQEVNQFLARYRHAYEYVLQRLTVNGKPALFQFDTSRTAIEEILAELLQASSLKPEQQRN